MNSNVLLPFAFSVIITSLCCLFSLGGGDGDLAGFAMNISGFCSIYDLITAVVAALAIAVGAALAASTKTKAAVMVIGSHILIKVIV